LECERIPARIRAQSRPRRVAQQLPHTRELRLQRSLGISRQILAPDDINQAIDTNWLPTRGSEHSQNATLPPRGNGFDASITFNSGWTEDAQPNRTIALDHVADRNTVKCS
jgi:hypothetical protein